MKNIWLLVLALIGLAGMSYLFISRETSSLKLQAHSGWTIIIPGITGDLAKRKLLPALFQLFKQGNVCTIIGTGRREADIKQILLQAQKFVGTMQDNEWEEFSRTVSYYVLDPKQEIHCKRLADRIASIEKQHTSSKRLIYLSLPADAFCPITHAFVNSKILEPHKAHYMAFEKPFGWNLKSAEEINSCLIGLLPEKQIYRVDHYNAKEATQTLPFLSENVLLKNQWNNKHIEAIEVIFREKIGLEGRGQFYDGIGAIKDVMQNHMLQVLAYIAVDRRKGRSSAEQKAAFINSLTVKKVRRGQYEGYRKEEGVSPTSSTETYAAVLLESSDSRWKSIPILLETGKALHEKATYLKIAIKDEGSQDPNALLIRLAPTESIAFELFGINKKRLVLTTEIAHRDAYESVLQDIISERLLYAVSFNEIEAQWRLIDSIQSFASALEIYPQGSAFSSKRS